MVRSRRAALRLGRFRRSGHVVVAHVVVAHVVVMVMMVVVMVMMVVHGSSHRSGRRFLRHSVSGEAERENGRGGKGLDHGKTFLWLGNPKRVTADDRVLRLNSI
jgi:ABC-type lipoprotein release transport system permease subunit